MVVYIRYYHTELCILRKKGWKLPPNFSQLSLRSANLWGQFLRDIIFIIPQVRCAPVGSAATPLTTSCIPALS